MLHDGAEDCRFDVLPLGIRFRYRDEVATEKHAGDARNAEQPLGKRRFRRISRARDVKGAVGQHRATRQEFQGCGIWRRFGLNEHLQVSAAALGSRPKDKLQQHKWEFPADRSTATPTLNSWRQALRRSGAPARWPPEREKCPPCCPDRRPA